MNSLKKLMRYLFIVPFLYAVNGLFMLAFGGLDDRSPADAPRTIKEFKRHLVKAKRGDAHAQYVVFLAYYDGRVVERDFVAADAWGTLSAKQGLAKAQFWLGYMHYNNYPEPLPIGEGDRDYKKAFYWFQLAAKQGQSGSQYHLGRFYENGWGGAAINHQQALYWYELADKQGHISAGIKIKEIHERYRQFEHYLMLAKTGNAEAQLKVRSACTEGFITNKQPTYGQDLFGRIDKNRIKQHCATL